MGIVFSGISSLVCGLISATCCACSMFRCCCTGGMGPNGVGKYMAKFIYVLLLGLATIIAFSIGQYGENNIVDENAGLFQFSLNCEQITGQNVCAGDPAIFRASCACVFFYATMLLGTIPRPTFSGDKNWVPLLGEGFHRGYWGLKLLVFFALLISSFFWPASFFDDNVYREIARVVSVFFLAVQVLVLIDFAYTWNDNWIDRAYEDDDDEPTAKGWLYALLFFAFLLYAAAIAGLVALFVFYSQCGVALTFCIITAGLFVLYTLLSFLNIHIVNLFVRCACREPYDPDDELPVSIAPASVVGCYCTYLLWSALRSNPDPSPECTPFDDFLQSNGAEVFIGIMFASLSLVWTAFAASNNAGNLLKGAREENEVGGLGGPGGAYQIGEDEEGKPIYGRDQNNQADDDENDSDSQIWLFHFLMMTASFYMAMVLTNFGVSEIDVILVNNASDPGSIQSQGDVGLISMWVKIAAQWASSAVFMWTLVAPYVLEEWREF